MGKRKRRAPAGKPRPGEAPSPPPAEPRDRERLFVLGMCALAASRILLYSLAFPFFGNLDERPHYDLVLKYSHGRLPQQDPETYGREGAEGVVLYSSAEFLQTAEALGGRFPPPVWTFENIRGRPEFLDRRRRWEERANYQSGSPPAYYLVAGLWTWIGRGLGLDGGHLLYWIRLLNAPFYAALVWVSYRFARSAFPDRPEMRLGLPLLVATFPQPVLHFVNSDVASPLFFGLAFLLLMEIRFERKPIWYHAVAGLAVAATFLTKLSNVAIFMPFCLVVASCLRDARLGRRGGNASRVAALVLAAVLPLGLWMVRNRMVFGEWMATGGKMRYFSWTYKPLRQAWSHPIFTPDGLWYFLTELTRRFWGGEITWHGQRLALAAADHLFLLTTVLALLAAALGLVRGWRDIDPRTRESLGLGFAVIAVSVAVLGYLSTRFDFGWCPNPSNESPYFVSGRLLAGVLLPFGAVYVYGIGAATRRLGGGGRAALTVVALLAAWLIFSQAYLLRSVFASHANWFHLSG